MKKELMEKIEEIKEELDALEELADKEPVRREKNSVFILSLADAARLLRGGFGGIFQVGDVIVSKHADEGRIAWNVIGKDIDHAPDKPEGSTLTLHMRETLAGTYSFDPSRPGAPWGRNVWAESGIRRWLNGDFLGGFTAEDQEAMQAVDKVTHDTSSGREERTHDRIFLLSCTEAGFAPGEYIKEEGAAYPFFTGDESRQKVDQDGEARSWWLRSPYPGYALNVRLVLPDGALSYYDALLGYGAAAACVIG